MMSKILDFILDKRTPPHLLPSFIHNGQVKKMVSKCFENRDLKVSITFDVEQNFGSMGDGNLTHLNEFIQDLKKNEYSTTLFIQGSIMSGIKENVIEMLDRHEIGMHGYNHEMWGNEVWFLKDKPISLEEKEKLFVKYLGELKDYGIYKPKSFRAPNMLINMETINLLDRFGFELDSSASSFREISIPKTINGTKIMAVPVSVDPIIKFKLKSFVPSSYYTVFNTKNLTFMGNENFIKSVMNIMCFQEHFSIPHHIVLLAHSWEFTDWKIRGFEYCSEENYKIFKNLTKELEKHFDVEYLKMSELKDAIQKYKL